MLFRLKVLVHVRKNLSVVLQSNKADGISAGILFESGIYQPDSAPEFSSTTAPRLFS
jgi:hypothetical protein